MTSKDHHICFLISILILILVLFSCRSEGYLSLPFAGGSIRTFNNNQHKIEGPLGRALNEVDDPSNDYPI